jgi:hypothetical protein
MKGLAAMLPGASEPDPVDEVCAMCPNLTYHQVSHHHPSKTKPLCVGSLCMYVEQWPLLDTRQWAECNRC